MIRNSKISTLKFILYSFIFLNILTISIGILDYFLWNESPYLLSEVSGWLITISFVLNTILLSYFGKNTNLEDTKGNGRKLNFMIDFFLFLTFGTLICMFLMATGQIWGIFVLGGYYLLFIVIIIIILSILSKKQDINQFLYFGNSLFEKNITKDRNIIERTLLVLIFIVFTILFIVAGILSHAQVTGGDRIFGQVTGAAVGITAGYIEILLFLIVVITLKALARASMKKSFYTILILGFLLGTIFTLPLFSRNLIIIDANNQFETMFGENWNEIPPNIKDAFLNEPFTASQFYFGYGNDRFNTSGEPSYYFEENLIYSNHTKYQLYYDSYIPNNKRTDFINIGKNSTVIVLHSGGWNDGNKGGDEVQLQKYLASRGFITFDIQYRLLDSGLMNTSADFGFDLGWQAPESTKYNNLRGAYSIKDMIKDIGDFTKHLSNLTDEERNYADLNSVIFLGVSAGGHLAAITAYGYNNPYFSGNFSAELNIKSVILFNPPNDAVFFFYEGHPMYYPLLIKGSPSTIPDEYFFYTPSNLINESSPPTILFHGTIDKMVPPINSEMLYNALIENNRNVIYIKGNYSGHGFDFGPYFAPIAGFYVERFLYHTLNS